jgi:hypothetical protein
LWFASHRAPVGTCETAGARPASHRFQVAPTSRRIAAHCRREVARHRSVSRKSPAAERRKDSRFMTASSQQKARQVPVPCPPWRTSPRTPTGVAAQVECAAFENHRSRLFVLSDRAGGAWQTREPPSRATGARIARAKSHDGDQRSTRSGAGVVAGGKRTEFDPAFR